MKLKVVVAMFEDYVYVEGIPDFNFEITLDDFEQTGSNLSKLKNVESLVLHCEGLTGCKINDNALSQLTKLKNSNINELGKLPNLTNLKITGYAVNVDFSPVKNVLRYVKKDPKNCKVNKTTTTTTTKKSSITTKKTTTTSVTSTSTNGKCGGNNGVCPSGQCCSKYDYCGTSDKHCGTGCQSEFGKCTATTSSNGKYGPQNGNTKCPSGQCCSKYGYCDTSDKYCGTGCQSEFGKCH
ncbi:hypothetical protein U3516DRAFT_734100 [Neocallimastix sp. 'constans']